MFFLFFHWILDIFCPVQCKLFVQPVSVPNKHVSCSSVYLVRTHCPVTSCWFFMLSVVDNTLTPQGQRWCCNNHDVFLSLVRPVEDSQSAVRQQWICWGALCRLQQLPEGLLMCLVSSYPPLSQFRSPVDLLNVLKWLIWFQSEPYYINWKNVPQINHMWTGGKGMSLCVMKPVSIVWKIFLI